jgi:hypothetical protein
MIPCFMCMQVLNAMARHMTSEGSTAADEASTFRQDLDVLLLASGPNGAGIGLPLLPEERFFPFWKWLGQVSEASYFSAVQAPALLCVPSLRWWLHCKA